MKKYERDKSYMIRFNYITKDFELEIPHIPTFLLFDINQIMLPIRMVCTNNYVQYFDLINLPEYMIDVDEKYVKLERVEGFNVEDRKLLYSRVSEYMEIPEAKKIFHNFILAEIRRRKFGNKYEFIPKEIPKIEDFIISCTLMYFK